jgi:hypothetical protein
MIRSPVTDTGYRTDLDPPLSHHAPFSIHHAPSSITPRTFLHHTTHLPSLPHAPSFGTPRTFLRHTSHLPSSHLAPSFDTPRTILPHPTHLPPSPRAPSFVTPRTILRHPAHLPSTPRAPSFVTVPPSFAFSPTRSSVVTSDLSFFPIASFLVTYRIILRHLLLRANGQRQQPCDFPFLMTAFCLSRRSVGLPWRIAIGTARWPRLLLPPLALRFADCSIAAFAYCYYFACRHPT